MGIAIGNIATNDPINSAPLDAIFTTYGNEINRLGAFLPASNPVGLAVATSLATPNALALRDSNGSALFLGLSTTAPAGLIAMTVRGEAGNPTRVLFAVQDNAGSVNNFTVDNLGAGVFRGSVTAPTFIGALTGTASNAAGVSAGSIVTASIADGAVTGGTGAGAKVATATLTQANVADGYVQQQTSPNMTTKLAAPLTYHNQAGFAVTVSGNSPTYTPPAAGGTQQYQLLYGDASGVQQILIDNTNAPAVSSSPAKPPFTNNMEPLAYVLLTNGQTSIVTANITDARGRNTWGTGGGGGGGGSTTAYVATVGPTGSSGATNGLNIFDILTNNSLPTTYGPGSLNTQQYGGWKGLRTALADASGYDLISPYSIPQAFALLLTQGSSSKRVQCRISATAPLTAHIGGTTKKFSTPFETADVPSAGSPSTYFVVLDTAGTPSAVGGAGGGALFLLATNPAPTLTVTQAIIATVISDGTNLQLTYIDRSPLTGYVAPYNPQMAYGVGGALQTASPTFGAIGTAGQAPSVTVYLPIAMRLAGRFGGICQQAAGSAVATGNVYMSYANSTTPSTTQPVPGNYGVSWGTLAVNSLVPGEAEVDYTFGPGVWSFSFTGYYATAAQSFVSTWLKCSFGRISQDAV